MTRTRTIPGALFVLAAWLVGSGALFAQTFSVIASWAGSGPIILPSRLVQGSDGSVYGTTEVSFGPGQKGAVFRLSPDGVLTTLHTFSGGDGWEPHAGVILASDGYLYGTTAAGGSGGGSNSGTIFKIATDGTAFKTLHSFVDDSDGYYPVAALIQAADGYLYGTTHADGGIFRIGTDGSGFTTLRHFNSGPGNLLQGTDGALYGTTNSQANPNDPYGSVFRMATDGTTLTTLHSFNGSDGAGPSGLIQAADGMLYGTTTDGGSPGHGTVFKVDTNGTSFATLHSFSSSDGASPNGGVIQAADGFLYGTTSDGGPSDFGTVFRIATDGTGFATLHNFANEGDGQWPFVGLIQASDGHLFGATSEGDGGPNYAGTIFRIDTSGTNLTTLHYFYYGGDGAYPYAGLIEGADGGLYGATFGYFDGGGPGTIFKITGESATPVTLHHFSSGDGALPSASLIQPSDGYLYGTTQSGGANLFGTVFKMTADGTVITLHVFSGNDGAYPWAGLIRASDGNLYGTTSSGGATPGYGTIFKLATDGTAFTTLHVFLNSDGAAPLASLIQGVDGNLYGTTSAGGVSPGYGTVFKIATDGSSFTTLHTFVNGDGAAPYGGVIQAADGMLYGTTSAGGGSPGHGTVFKVATNGTSFATLHGFGNSDGATPYAGVIQAADGFLYGTTFEGGSGYGTVFKTDTNGANLTTLHNFSYDSDGANPYASLTQAADGGLYGTTTEGGPLGGGTAFRLTACSLSHPPLINVDHCLAAETEGVVASASGSPADTYRWSVFGGTITDGQGTQSIAFTSGAAGTRLRIQVFETDASGCVGAADETAQVDFVDVPSADPFEPYVCIIGREAITAGCGGDNYCRDNAVTRAQIAVFLLKAEHGSSYVPPPCTGIFGDVPCSSQFADWIERLSAEGITGGCGGGDYCPTNPVRRDQMAVFLLKAEHGSSYMPPTCAGTFGDVACPSPFADWIEQLAAENITGGCGGGNYCPNNASTRGQMAVFLVKTLGL